jgi:hypothetical protein
MSHPVYVLLPRDVEWTPLPGSGAQAAAPVKWYLRSQMPEAATQTVVLVDDGPDLADQLALVAARAAELGGLALDGATQEPITDSSLA